MDDTASAPTDRLQRAELVAFDTVDPESADATWALQQYYAELNERFPTGFDPGDAPTPGLFVVLRSAGRTVGCGGVQRINDDRGEIKRMWIHPEFRGWGLGRRLLDHLEQCTSGLGCHRVVLDTNAVLSEAIAMYERSGYRSIDRYNDNPYAMRWFEKTLTDRA